MADKSKVMQSVMEYLDKKGIDYYYYPGCSEVGYLDIPVLAANWNKVSDKFSRWVEDYFEDTAYAHIEWSDEWMSCECGKAVRSVGNSWEWEPSYLWASDCEISCRECWENDFEDIINWYKNETGKAVPSDFIKLLEKEGWECFGNEEFCNRYQTGWHQGMNDDPKAVAKVIQQELPECDFIFAILENSQFYTNWTVYIKPQNEE